MKYAKSEHLGHARDAEARLYSLHFYGENEGAAVITGPVPVNTSKLEAIPEVHREPAVNVDEACEKLGAWIAARGWHR